jgi:polyphosphate glucokinase
VDNLNAGSTIRRTGRLRGSYGRAVDAPTTLALDIGGTGLKATVLDPAGQPLADAVRVATTYPLPPHEMLDALAGLAGQLPPFDRVSAGFPGVVRHGRIRSAPHFITTHGPGTPADPALVAAWDDFDLARALAERLARPTKVVNDADLQGAAVVSGRGLEVVLTLGTGLGSAVYVDGRLGTHLELAHHPFRNGETYNEQVGDAARKKIGAEKWNRRVVTAVDTIRALLLPDHLYIGGGNSANVTADLGPDVTIVDNSAGLLGGIKLWGDHAIEDATA